MRRYFIAIFIVIILVLTGCNSEENAKKSLQEDSSKNEEINDQKENKQVTEASSQEEMSESIFDNLPLIPTTSNGFIEQKSGSLVGEDNLYESERLKEELHNLPPLDKNATPEQVDKYFKFIYSLMARDFPNPADIIKKWEFSNFGNPDLPDKKYQFKENYNVEIILDSSGSMANLIGSKTRMELAKQAIRRFLGNVPKEANVSLRVYGHKGSSKDSDKSLSCSAIEQVYGFEKYNEQKFNASLEKFQASGWTPLAKSLEESKKAFEKFDAEKNTNLIYVVSDGIETCDGDPVQAAKDFGNTNISPIINVIGFGADDKAQQQLKEVAKSANGVYTTVTNQEELGKEFDRAKEVLKKWEEWKMNSLKNVNSQKVENSFDILEFTNEWSRLTDLQYVEMNRVFGIMRDQGIIDVYQQDKLQAKNDEVENNLKKVKEDISNELENLSVTNLDRVKNEIKRKYSENVQ